MAKNNEELAKSLVTSTGQMTITAWEAQFSDWIKNNGKRLNTLAGSKEDANRLSVTLLHVIGRNPKLMECKFSSLMECLMHSASLRLFPGPLGECAYLPFKGVATFVAMYPGLCKLAYNSGIVRDISYNVVYEGDEFEWEEGTNAFLRFRPALDLSEKERGKRLYAWAVIKTIQGTVITVRGERFIEHIRKKAPFGDSPSSPWKTDTDAMWIKTVIKQALKTIPKSIELASALDLDNASERPELVKGKILEFNADKLLGVNEGKPADGEPEGSTEDGSSSETTVASGEET